MAKHDHCNVCDYSESNGAPNIGVNPGRNGKVRRNGEEMLCETCVADGQASRVHFLLADLEKESNE